MDMRKKGVLFMKTQIVEEKEGGNAVRGTVKWFNNEKGYGFIDSPGKEDIFVHYSAIKCEGYKTLAEGQMVEFKLLETSKGLQAVNVTPIQEAVTTA